MAGRKAQYYEKLPTTAESEDHQTVVVTAEVEAEKFPSRVHCDENPYRIYESLNTVIGLVTFITLNLTLVF